MERRERLEWLRDELVATWEVAEPRERAGLAKQIRDTLTELAVLGEAQPVGDVVDEFSAKLAAKRGTATPDPGVPAKGGKSRARSS